MACGTAQGAVLIWENVKPNSDNVRVVMESEEHKSAVCSLRWRTQEAIS